MKMFYRTLAKRKRSIKKGAYVRSLEQRDANTEFVEINPPETVTIPLKQGFGCENPPVVQKGDRVRAGQIIGRDDDSICSPVHSSVSGKVVDIVEINYIHEYSKESLDEKIRAVKIKVLNDKIQEPGEGTSFDWEKESPEKIRELLYLTGVTSLAQTGIPTEHKSSPFSPEHVKNIIINGIYTEPFVYPVIQLPQEIEKYRTGLSILSHTFPQATVHVAVDKKAFEQLKTFLVSEDKIKLYSFSTKHPQGLSQILIRSLFGDKLSYGTFPMDKGILILSQEVPLIIYQAVVEGIPFTRKRVSLGGSGVKKETIVDAPFGVSLEELFESFVAKETRCQFILGGPLTGSYLENFSVPVGKEIDSVVILPEKEDREFLAFLRPGLKKDSYSRAFLSAILPVKEKKASVDLHGEKRPCVYCSFCEQVCPVDILPYQIYQCFTHEFTDEVERLKPIECVDCSLCSYVCPSKLPLSETLRRCRKELYEKTNSVVYQQEKGRLIVGNNFLAGSVKKTTGTNSER